MSKGKKRKNTIKIKKRKTKKSKRRKNKDNIKAGMKLKPPEIGKSITKKITKRNQPREAPKISSEGPEKEPIIELDSKTEFDGRESWRPGGDRGILKLYNISLPCDPRPVMG